MRAEALGHLLGRFRIPQIDTEQRLGAVHQVHVRVDESRNHEPARQIDDPRGGANLAFDLRCGSDAADPVAADGNGFRPRTGAVHGKDAPVDEGELNGARLSVE